jgi:hypothetical protein
MLFCFRSLNPKAICWSGWDAPQILPTPKNSGYGGHLFSCQDLYDFLCSIGCKNIHDTETLDSHQILKKTKPHTHRKKSSSLLPILDALQLDDGWPESEKDVFQVALSMVVVKKVGEWWVNCIWAMEG